MLFEFLSRYCETDELRVEDQAEQRAMWNLCCLLEKELVALFDSDYAKLLQSARYRLRNKDDDCEPGAAPKRGPAAHEANSIVPGAGRHR